MLLCYITDRHQFPGNPIEQRQRVLEKVAECVTAGVHYIQLREKDLSIRELESLAGDVMRLFPANASTRLLINSRLDVALACGAAGVHLPSRDLPPSEARSLLAGSAVIGVSTHSLEEAMYAESHGADFAVFGPVFEKNFRVSADGLERLRQACNRPKVGTPMPLLALGGVTADNAAQCIEAGAAGVAGIRLFQENNVQQLVETLKTSSTQRK
ncbi:MAG: thiamine phosphate synthase [Candidatus Angelobacter sp. Gp1-AA117]|nr:MAG: thiamine phosphate synthase [Candidatus Angelobacter sp. Gp1-AA117]